MKHLKWLTLLVLIALFIPGCWDTINLEDRGFIMGSAVDLAKDGKEPTFIVTNQLAITQQLQLNASEGSSGDEEPFSNITTRGMGIYQINDDISARSSKTPYYEHMKVLVISKDLAENPDTLVKLLDYYLRDVSIRRGLLIAVSKGDAKSILDFQEPESELPARNLRMLLEQSHENSGYFRPFTIGDVEQYHMVDRSFVLPYLILDKHVERKGGAVFQGPKKKMVGTLGVDDTHGMELFSGKTKLSLIDFPEESELFGLKIISMRRDLSIDTSDIHQLKVKNKLIVEGVIKEAKSEENFMEQKKFKELEKKASEKIEKRINQSIETAQDELNADIFNIWKTLETKHYKTWKKVEDDWEQGENYFSKVDFDIEVDTKIYSSGTSNQTDSGR